MALSIPSLPDDFCALKYLYAGIEPSKRNRFHHALQTLDTAAQGVDAGTLDEVIAKGQEEPIDICIIDADGRDMTATISLLKRFLWNCGFIVLTDTFEPLLYAHFYAQGVHAMVRLENISQELFLQEICNGIIHALTNRQYERRMRKLAMTDPLTGLGNRTMFHQRVSAHIEGEKRYSRDNQHVCILMADVNDFKQVNDTWGHRMGDALLVAVAERLRYCLRQTDLVCRFGGDEFVIMIGRMDIAGVGIQLIIDKIQDSILAPFTLSKAEIRCTLSFGYALHPIDGGDVASLLEVADRRMYATKKSFK